MAPETLEEDFSMFRGYGNIGGTASVGLLVLRLAAGSAFIFHGWGKIQHMTTWMDKFPHPPAPYLQAAAAIAEFGGGIAWIVGFLTPLFSLMIACTMATAFALVHYPAGDVFVAANVRGQEYLPSYEPALMYFAIAVCLLLVGPGQISLDHYLFGRRRVPAPNLPPYANR
jgi:putative oxidoreductase